MFRLIILLLATTLLLSASLSYGFDFDSELERRDIDLVDDLDEFFVVINGNTTFETISGVISEGGQLFFLGVLGTPGGGRTIFTFTFFPFAKMFAIGFIFNNFKRKVVDTCDTVINCTCHDGTTVFSDTCEIDFDGCNITQCEVSYTDSHVVILSYYPVVSEVVVTNEDTFGNFTNFLANIDTECYGERENLATCDLQITEIFGVQRQSANDVNDQDFVSFTFEIDSSAIITATPISSSVFGDGMEDTYIFLSVVASGNVWAVIDSDEAELVITATSGTTDGPFQITVTVSAFGSDIIDISVAVTDVLINELTSGEFPFQLHFGDAATKFDEVVPVGEFAWFRWELGDVLPGVSQATTFYLDTEVLTSTVGSTSIYSTGFQLKVGFITTSGATPENDPLTCSSEFCRNDFATFSRNGFSQVFQGAPLSLYLWLRADNVAGSGNVRVKAESHYEADIDSQSLVGSDLNVRSGALLLLT